MDLFFFIRRSIAFIFKKLAAILEPIQNPIESSSQTLSQVNIHPINNHYPNQGNISPGFIQSEELLPPFNLYDYIDQRIPTNVVILISDHIHYLYHLNQVMYQSQITSIMVILFDYGYLTTTFVKAITDLYAHLGIPLKANNTKPARYSSLNYKGTHSMAYIAALSFLSPLINLDKNERHPLEN